ncbi:MAG: N-acetyltransferase [Acetobacteraceae bacterium]|nr:N-acetyltransferase [Acetobacteraceae bacterium]MBV8589564.1 N-acetyltransferase [Acetobacteraceae bacterium]
MSFAVRPAGLADVPEIQSIYAHHVLHGTGSFEELPPSVEEMADHFGRVFARGWVWLVAADATGVLGYAYFAQLRDRSAYRFTLEDSVYMRPDAQGRGIGRELLQQLINAAAQHGFKQMVAVIGDAENQASVRLHYRLGFHKAGHLHAVGWKFGRWLDVIYMQKELC